MAETPTISVIIPHLSAPDALARCLAALAAQLGDGVAFEVIVVDNGSPELPHATCSAHDFVQLASEPTPGPGPARSHGARLARGAILAFVDCDCIPQPGWIAGIARHMAEHPACDVLGGDVRIAFANPRRPTAIEAYEAVFGYRMQLYIQRDGYAATCNLAMRRAAFDQVGDFAGITIAEDLDWGQRATAWGLRTDYVPDIVIHTPARTSFAELARKWDRHIGHDHATLANPRAKARWIARALMIALSPPAELGRIVRSPRLSGLRARLVAAACLTRVRFYRSRRMLGLAFVRTDHHALAQGWRHNG